MSDSQLHPPICLEARVPVSSSGGRLDHVANVLFPEYSRSRIQAWIKKGQLLVDSQRVKPHTKVIGGELLVLEAHVESMAWVPENIPLTVVYEDEHILVINKNAGLVVHPGAGNWSGTLLNGLLYRFPELAEVPRAGIVHRLDRDTSGLMVVARTLTAQAQLVEQLQARRVSRTYWALAWGSPGVSLDGASVVETLIGRHPKHRTRMAVVTSGGKFAKTHYRALAHFKTADDEKPVYLLELKLETGRTHQIRVHMAHLGMPLIGDPVYGKKASVSTPANASLHTFIKGSRQALHAKKLGFKHPVTKTDCEWEAVLPDDMQSLVSSLTLGSER